MFKGTDWQVGGEVTPILTVAVTHGMERTLALGTNPHRSALRVWGVLSHVVTGPGNLMIPSLWVPRIQGHSVPPLSCVCDPG